MNWDKCSHIYGLRQYRDGEKAPIALALAGKISPEFKRFIEFWQMAKMIRAAVLVILRTIATSRKRQNLMGML
jgi:hypothetical protein